jgi:hypothetical protein
MKTTLVAILSLLTLTSVAQIPSGPWGNGPASGVLNNLGGLVASAIPTNYPYLNTNTLPTYAHTNYVSATGNDSTAVSDNPNYPWRTIDMACSNVNYLNFKIGAGPAAFVETNFYISVGAGSWVLSNNFDCPGCALVGAGESLTYIYGQGTNFASGLLAAIELDTNEYFANFTVFSATNGNGGGYCFGMEQVQHSGNEPTNVVVTNVCMIANGPIAVDMTNYTVITADFFNPIIVGGVDGMILGSGDRVDVVNPNITMVEGGVTNRVTGIIGSNGVTFVYGGLISCVATSTPSIAQPAASVTLIGSAVYEVCTNATTRYPNVQYGTLLGCGGWWAQSINSSYWVPIYVASFVPTTLVTPGIIFQTNWQFNVNSITNYMLPFGCSGMFYSNVTPVEVVYTNGTANVIDPFP